ncbi:MAG: ATP-dependent helicase HrpB [Gammaproteobacteria bacterium]
MAAIDPTLPIAPVLPELREVLDRHHTALLDAPPGSGKTTGVPLALLDAPWLSGRGILMLEPRRLAARAAARRMADLLGEPLGRTVGYQVRFDRRTGPDTRIEVVTEGILTRRLHADPELTGISMVIFDEFHERHLEGDLGLALCRDVQEGLREDLRLLIMSATLDTAGLKDYLGDIPVLRGEGRAHPVDIHHADRVNARYGNRNERPDPGRTLAEAVPDILARHPDGDVLAFLPGAAEIRRAAQLLEGRLPGDVRVHTLFGDMDRAAQDAVLKPTHRGQGRKLVLASPIAESSLTLEGVRIVIDGGLEKRPRFDPGTGLTRLETVRISQASATQRAGRAGRQGPGTCYRLWPQARNRDMQPQRPPEILDADLAPLLLDLGAWGVNDPSALHWPTPPPSAHVAQARDLLTLIHAIDKRGRITRTGRAMSTLPVHPRLAHMLVNAGSAQRQALGARIAALLSERDILGRNHDHGAALEARLDHLERSRPRRGQAGAIERAVVQLTRLLKLKEDVRPAPVTEAGALLALAYPDRVARRQGPVPGSDGIRYQLANGRGALLAAADPLAGREFIVAAHVDDRSANGTIRLAAEVDLPTLTDTLGEQLSWHTQVRWDRRGESVEIARELRVDRLVLDSHPHPEADAPSTRDAIQAAMISGLRAMGSDALPWNDASRSTQSRAQSMRHWFPRESWPDLDDATLMEQAEEVFGPWLDRITRREHLKRLDMKAILEARLGWERQRELDGQVPEHLTVPSGSRIRLNYEPGQPPVLAARIQELFGQSETPTVAGGRIPVLIHLLSPARRPIQVTQDLGNFWRNTYAEVRKELKGRYPKHYWPDDPMTAEATHRVRPRRG